MPKHTCLICGRKEVLHRFPNDLKRCTKWLEQCKRMDVLEKGLKFIRQNYRLCKLHFKPWCYASSISRCLIRCAHPEIFDIPPLEANESLSLSSDEDGNKSPNDIEILSEHVCTNRQIHHKNPLVNRGPRLMKSDDVKGSSVNPSLGGENGITSDFDRIESRCQNRSTQNKKNKTEIDVFNKMDETLLSDFQKAKNTFSSFNQKTYTFSEVEMARLCLVLVRCKKMTNLNGSTDTKFEELVNGLIYSFQAKFYDKTDQSLFDELICSLIK